MSNYRRVKLKLHLEQFGMAPFVWLGRIFGWLFPLPGKPPVFLFFPNADIGGSPQVNVDITNCIKDSKPVIIFSKKPKNNQFRELFNIEGVRVIDLQSRIDKKIFHFINFFYRGVVASWVNRSPNPVVFGGECIYFYKIIPHIRKNIPAIELCHLDTWLSYSIGFIDRIDMRIFSTEQLKREVESQYVKNQVPKELYNRLSFIDNAITIPLYQELNNEKLEVVFIGRGSPQKRVPLITAMAQQMEQSGDAIHFSFVGDVEKVIDTSQYPYCRFYGNVADKNLMAQIYQQSDVLILTSAFEGLPIVVMTMMAYGKIVLSTAVNGIPDYIHHLVNGLLITETEEDKIIEQGIELLRMVIRDPALKNSLGLKSREIAIEKFSPKVFCKIYRGILFIENRYKFLTYGIILNKVFVFS